ncbi:hypothetical protein RvY_15088 [Ramazzottius varieornatus]|uniref:Endonuclease/exonuclease/phosphatase domain-containing protein n=1 Tax=Ramazzottius varieornatus TaxID=947166 RepID=A0A1D1VV28_RAMVA|nr:hypothetical protein RvY_15088 [Ramazzottius varieornatus]
MPVPQFMGVVGKKLVIRYANVNGIRSKSNEVKRWMEDRMADVVALVEIMAGPSTADCSFCDPAFYKLQRLDRYGCQTSTGGGVALVIRKEFQIRRMVEYELVRLEVLWVEVIALRMNLLIGVVHAPGYDSEVFSKLRTSMERISPHLRRNILMLGDFNCPNISWSDKASGSLKRERDLLSLQSEFRLWQKVWQITRERGKSCSSLDLVFVSQLGLIRNVKTIKPQAATNDHHGLQYFLMLMTPKFVVKSRKQWRVDDVTSNEFRGMLASVDWNGMFDRRTKDPADQTAWKELGAQKNKLILRDKHRRLRKIATSSRRNPAAVWKCIKKNTVCSPIPPISVPGSDDRYLVYPQDKAEFISKTFADEHVDCPVHYKAHLPPLPVCLMEPAISPRCPDLLITTTAILTITKKLDVNKAAGSSLITNRLLKVAGVAIVYPLSRLFNLIIQTGQFPTVWKKADVVPIPKKGGSAFRPILSSTLVQTLQEDPC